MANPQEGHVLYTSLKINIFDVPDTMSYTNQFVPDIKEIVTYM